MSKTAEMSSVNLRMYYCYANREPNDITSNILDSDSLFFIYIVKSQPIQWNIKIYEILNDTRIINTSTQL